MQILLRLADNLPQLLDHIIEIRITSTEFSRNPVTASFSDCLAVDDYLKLASITWLSECLNLEFCFNEGHETRNLGLIIFSRGAINYFDFHLVYILHDDLDAQRPSCALHYRLRFDEQHPGKPDDQCRLHCNGPPRVQPQRQCAVQAEGVCKRPANKGAHENGA